jgi:ribosomal protein L7Ae-like RNA K-turn-binding protein
MTEAERPDLRLLGLAARAGALVYGTDLVRRAAKARRVHLAIVASDISDNTREKLASLEQSGVVVIGGPDRGGLGALVGKGPLSVIGVSDAQFAERLRSNAGHGQSGSGIANPDSIREV